MIADVARESTLIAVNLITPADLSQNRSLRRLIGDAFSGVW